LINLAKADPEHKKKFYRKYRIYVLFNNSIRYDMLVYIRYDYAWVCENLLRNALAGYKEDHAPSVAFMRPFKDVGVVLEEDIAAEECYE